MTSNTPSPRSSPSSVTGMLASARGISTPSKQAVSTVRQTYRCKTRRREVKTQSMMCVMPDLPESALIVLYDSDCGFCEVVLALLLKWDRARHLTPLPIQSSGGEELLSAMTTSERL